MPQAENVLALVRGLGEVMASNVNESPNGANVTASKTGIQVRFVSVAAVCRARETITLRVAAADVKATYDKINAAILALNTPAARIAQSALRELNPQDVRGQLEVDVPRTSRAAVDGILESAGVAVMQRDVSRSTDLVNTLDTKIHYAMDIQAAATLPPKRATTVTLDVANAEDALQSARQAVAAIKSGAAREVSYNLSNTPDGRRIGRITIEAPVADAAEVLARVRPSDAVQKTFQVNENQQINAGTLSRESIDITFEDRATLVPADKGVGATVHSALSAALGALLWSLYVIVMGVVFIAPFAAVLWLVTLPWRRRRKAAAA